jgi:DMSO/TMAO reductase YedYZ molybdopterin-dependent catalytic subunit
LAGSSAVLARVVVPGHIGARSVKWLKRIEVRPEPWRGRFQHVVYRPLPDDGTPWPDVLHDRVQVLDVV